MDDNMVEILHYFSASNIIVSYKIMFNKFRRINWFHWKWDWFRYILFHSNLYFLYFTCAYGFPYFAANCSATIFNSCTSLIILCTYDNENLCIKTTYFPDIIANPHFFGGSGCRKLKCCRSSWSGSLTYLISKLT